MNLIKFRPVGKPSGAVVTVKCSQSTRAINTKHRAQIGLSRREVIAMMDRKGFVRCGLRSR